MWITHGNGLTWGTPFVREAFDDISFRTKVKRLFIHLEEAFDQYRGSGPVTLSQLYYSLVGRGVESPSFTCEVPASVEKGLMAGHVDWGLLPDGATPLELTIGTGPMELWVFSKRIAPWVAVKGRELDLTTLCAHHGGFPLHAAYACLERHHAMVEGRPIHVMFLIDGTHVANKAMLKSQKLLTRMFTVRLARRRFNELVGREMWLPPGMMMPTGGNVDEPFAKAMEYAGKVVSANLRFDALGLLPRDVEGLNRSLRYLHQVRFVRLNRIIDTAVRSVRYPETVDETNYPPAFDDSAEDMPEVRRDVRQQGAGQSPVPQVCQDQ
jgi:hypothetical protein